MRASEPTPAAPPPPRYSRRFHRLFAIYLRRHARRHFSGLRLAPDGLPPAVGEEPLVIYSNHPGWWDPLVFMLLADRFYPDREAYGPMDAAELERFRFFRRLGVFGVEAGTLAGARTFLETSLEVLARPRPTLWVTAEGRFTDVRRRPLALAPGLAHLTRRLGHAVLVPLAIEYVFWDRRLPEALVRFGEPFDLTETPRGDTARWRRHLGERLEETLDALAVDSQSRDPERFETFLDGRSGPGGIYQLWTRLKQRFVEERRDGPPRPTGLAGSAR